MFRQNRGVESAKRLRALYLVGHRDLQRSIPAILAGIAQQDPCGSISPQTPNYLTNPQFGVLRSIKQRTSGVNFSVTALQWGTQRFGSGFRRAS